MCVCCVCTNFALSPFHQPPFTVHFASFDPLILHSISNLGLFYFNMYYTLKSIARCRSIWTIPQWYRTGSRLSILFIRSSDLQFSVQVLELVWTWKQRKIREDWGPYERYSRKKEKNKNWTKFPTDLIFSLFDSLNLLLRLTWSIHFDEANIIKYLPNYGMKNR